MGRFTVTTAAILTALCITSVGYCEEEAQREGKVICDKQYRIVSPGDKGQELGQYHIMGISREDGKQIEIIEQLTMDHRGKKAEYASAVIYKTAPSLTPVKGSVETKIDGRICMKGSVEFQDDTLSYSCVGLLDKRTGKTINPPKQHGKRGVRKPAGTLLFQSALPAIGPKFVAKEGELKNVVFIEFPDDIGAPELINLKEGYRIVRDEPDQMGRYSIRVFGAHSAKPVMETQFDKNNTLISMSAFGKVKLVEVKGK